VAAGALPPVCTRAGMAGSLPLGGRIPAATGSRFRVGGFLGRAGSLSPAGRVRCGAG
jgi:hypothetical protein